MRVLLVDDHALFGAGLKLLPKELYPDVELLDASTVSHGANLAVTEHPDIVHAEFSARPCRHQ